MKDKKTKKAFRNFAYSYDFNFLSYLGWWHYSFENILRQRIFFAYRCGIFVAYVGTLSLAAAELYLHRRNLRKVSTNLTTTLFAISAFFKNVVILINGRNIDNLRKNLFLDSLSQAEPYQMKLKENFWKRFGWVRKTYFFASFVILPIRLSTSLHSFIKGPRETPFSIWIPFDLNKDEQFLFLFVLHTIIGVYTILLTMHQDLSSYGLIIQLHVQYKILVNDVAQLEIQFKNWENGKDGDANKFLFFRKLRESLKECLNRYTKLNWYVNELSSSYNLYLTIAFIFAVALLIANGMEILQQLVSTHTFTWYYQWGYTLIILTNAFGGCLMGTIILEERKTLNEKVYNIPWYKMDMPSQKDFITLIVGTQNIQTIKIGKLFNLDFTLFQRIIRFVSGWLALFWHFLKS